MKLTRTSDDEKDPKWRLAVEDELLDDDGVGDGLITISEEDLTSCAATAQVTGIRTAIDLTTEQAQWLYFALGRILVARGGRDGHCIHGVNDETANRMRPGLPPGPLERQRLSGRTPLTREKIGGAAVPQSSEDKP